MLTFFLFLIAFYFIFRVRNLLKEKEAELKALRGESADGRAENAELLDSLKRERSEVYTLRDVAQELRSLLGSRNNKLTQ